MTHTLHRRGKAQSLERDYVVLVMSAKGYNDEGSTQKLKQALNVMANHSAVNLGDMRTGSLYKEGTRLLYEKIKDTSIVHGVFKTRGDMQQCVAELKRLDLGMSVVVSGLFDELFQTLATIGMKPHTVQYSLGTFGNISMLPSEDVLEVTTMCGHHLVSPILVRKLVSDINRNKITVREAARTLAGQCVCGVFNPDRAETILVSMIK